MSPKRLNVNFLKSSRDALNLTQAEFAEQAGVSLRTIVNIEAGLPCRPGTLKKIEDFFLKSEINGGPTDDDYISSNLVISNSHSIIKNVGKVSSGKSINEEKEWLIPGPYNDGLEIPWISDPYMEDGEGGELRAAQDDDYVVVKRRGIPFDNAPKALEILFEHGAKENTLWHSTSFLDDEGNEQAMNALEKLDGVLKRAFYNDEDTGISKITRDMRQQAEFLKAYSMVLECGLTFFIGMQHLIKSSNYIFFIETSDVKKIDYEIESAHPKYMNRNKIPYFSLRQGPKYVRLDEKPAVVLEAMSDFYPSTSDEESWYDLSLKIEREFSEQQAADFAEHIVKFYS